MSLAIALQVWLEGKGDVYEPENSDMNDKKRNIIDPLFEGENDEVAE
jgi:hypothetical protein